MNFTQEEEQRLIELIKEGAIFIYPTDTIYGIGCNTLNEQAVEKIKDIKGRENQKPLSIIAPSKEWIFENTRANREIVDKYLPGPYTLILEKKDKNFLSYVSPNENLGIRIPKHEFTKLIEKAGVPFITTSANLSGEQTASEFEDLSEELIDKVDVIVNGGTLSGIPSTLILPDGKELKR